MVNVNVTWTGEWPRRCKGRWIFEVDGKDYRYLLPFANDDGFDLPADTYGTYECWDVDSEGEREWYHFEAGLDIDDWIDQNREWLEVVTPEEDDWDDIYYAFQEEDWRFKECGGCVHIRMHDMAGFKNTYINTVLDIDDQLVEYCTGCVSHNSMGIEGVEYKFSFPNGCDISVLKCYGSYGWNMDLWEVDLYIDGNLAYIRDFEFDVIGNLDDEGVNKLLLKVKDYPKED